MSIEGIGRPTRHTAESNERNNKREELLGNRFTEVDGRDIVINVGGENQTLEYDQRQVNWLEPNKTLFSFLDDKGIPYEIVIETSRYRTLYIQYPKTETPETSVE